MSHPPPLDDARSRPSAARQRPRRIGVYGARGAGKTCYLACLYGRRSDGQTAIVFRDEETLDHLAAIWGELELGGTPAATAADAPVELEFDLAAGDDRQTRIVRTWPVRVQDYAGELVQSTIPSETDLEDVVHDWLASCHAMLVFINVNERNPAALTERLNELNFLLAELNARSHDGHAGGLPLALVLSQWDAQSPQPEDAEEESRRAEQLLAAHPVLRQIRDTLSALSEQGRFAVFPVSALGGNRDARLDPETGPAPFNLLAPMRWAVERSDEFLLDRARRRAAAVLSGRFWRPYSTAIAIYTRLIQSEGIDKGPVHAAIRKEMSKLKRKRRRRRGVLFLAACLMVFLGLGGWEWREYDHIKGLLTNPTATPREVSAACGRYVNGWGPLRWCFRGEIQQRLREFQTQHSAAELAVLRSFRESHSGEEEAAGRLAHDQSFLEAWPSSAQAAEVAGWQKDDEAAAARHQAKLDKRRAYHRLLKELAPLPAGKFDVQIAKCLEFLEQFPSLEDAATDRLTEEVRQQLQDFRLARRNADWAAVVDFKAKNPHDFTEIVRRANAYLNTPGAQQREEAEKLIARTEANWDRHKYKEARDAARAAKDGQGLEKARRAAEAYLQGPQPNKAMKAQVQRWIDWRKGFDRGKGYKITVRSVSIPDGSKLAESVTTEKVRVTLELGETATTEWHNGQNPTIDEELGPFNFQWGRGKRLRVRVEEYDRFDPDDVAEGEIRGEDEPFLLGKAHGEFVVKCAKEKEITIKLDCPAAVPPELPEFIER